LYSAVPVRHFHHQLWLSHRTKQAGSAPPTCACVSTASPPGTSPRLSVMGTGRRPTGISARGPGRPGRPRAAGVARLAHPWGPCWSCSGTGKNKGSTRKRYSPGCGESPLATPGRFTSTDRAPDSSAGPGTSGRNRRLAPVVPGLHRCPPDYGDDDNRGTREPNPGRRRAGEQIGAE
jgi:hypothetical protein